MDKPEWRMQMNEFEQAVLNEMRKITKELQDIRTTLESIEEYSDVKKVEHLLGVNTNYKTNGQRPTSKSFQEVLRDSRQYLREY